jgi:hypothetical protein
LGPWPFDAPALWPPAATAAFEYAVDGLRPTRAMTTARDRTADTHERREVELDGVKRAGRNIATS